MTHIDLYRAFGLDRGQPSPVLDQHLAHLLQATGPTDVQRRTQLDIARKILGDPARRAFYDRQFADPAAPPMTHGALQQIAAMPSAQLQQYPRPPVPQAPQAVPPMSPAVPTALGDPQAVGTPKRGLGKPILIVLGVVVVVVVALVAALALIGGDDDAKEAGGNGALGEQSKDIQIDTNEAERGQILRDSSNFQYLSAPKRIMPGAMYIVDLGGGQYGKCSLGWMAQLPSDAQHIYNITAGHCGEVGQKVYLPVNGEQDMNSYVPIGKFVAQSYDEKTLTTGDDYAIIQFDSSVTKYIDASPNITALNNNTIELVGVMTPQQLALRKPYMCHLGFRSGLSCGPFREMTTRTNVVFESITDHGDSGGVVWAFDPDDPTQTKIAAAAIVSWVEFNTDAAATNGKTIAGVLESTGLQLVK